MPITCTRCGTDLETPWMVDQQRWVLTSEPMPQPPAVWSPTDAIAMPPIGTLHFCGRSCLTGWLRVGAKPVTTEAF